VPVAAGGAGVLLGPVAFAPDADLTVDLDSHVRYLSGIFLALGIAFWTTVPGIARKTGRFRLLAALVVAGGLARLLSLLLAGTPSAGHLAGLGLELVVVPLLVLWQSRIAR
jgi:hypothetical protein